MRVEQTTLYQLVHTAGSSRKKVHKPRARKKRYDITCTIIALIEQVMVPMMGFPLVRDKVPVPGEMYLRHRYDYMSLFMKTALSKDKPLMLFRVRPYTMDFELCLPLESQALRAMWGKDVAKELVVTPHDWGRFRCKITHMNRHRFSLLCEYLFKAIKRGQFDIAPR